jgi:histone acetyltransferase (RNA polymerase elongator complex component)
VTTPVISALITTAESRLTRRQKRIPESLIVNAVNNCNYQQIVMHQVLRAEVHQPNTNKMDASAKEIKGQNKG